MPLPDADPDKRMYKLLKNIDLENLSFADFQTTAQTVFAEPEAEDTLRRIVLINLARMSVAGDWNGLTTSGGGGAPSTGGYTSNYWYCPAGNMSASAAGFTCVADKIYLLPIWVTADMTLEAIAATCGNIPGSLRLGIYNYSSTGLGGTLLADAGTAASPTYEWKIISGLSTTVSQGHYFLAIQSDGNLPATAANMPYGAGGGSYNQIPFSTTEATPALYSFGMMRYDVSYATGFSDLTLLAPDAFEYEQIIIEMRPA